jgi:hypothetical protein
MSKIAEKTSKTQGFWPVDQIVIHPSSRSILSSTVIPAKPKPKENLQESYSRCLAHLAGKFERYRINDEKTLVFKDVITLSANGGTLLETITDSYHGQATYLNNAVLQINIMAQTVNSSIALNMMMFVGENDRKNLRCLHAISLIPKCGRQPTAHFEVVIPVLEGGYGPECIRVDSRDYFTLKYRYPDMIQELHQRPLSVPDRVDW